MAAPASAHEEIGARWGYVDLCVELADDCEEWHIQNTCSETYGIVWCVEGTAAGCVTSREGVHDYHTDRDMILGGDGLSTGVSTQTAIAFQFGACTFDRPQRDVKVVFDRQLLTHQIGIAIMLEKSFCQPRIETPQSLRRLTVRISTVNFDIAKPSVSVSPDKRHP